MLRAEDVHWKTQNQIPAAFLHRFNLPAPLSNLRFPQPTGAWPLLGKSMDSGTYPMILHFGNLLYKVIVIVELLYQIARHRKIVLCYMR
jgi:hypothetical protein